MPQINGVEVGPIGYGLMGEHSSALAIGLELTANMGQFRSHMARLPALG